MIVAGCGDADEPARPAAATDTTVQPAAPPPPPTCRPSAAAAAPDATTGRPARRLQAPQRRAGRPRALPRAGRARRQHGDRVRLHAAVRGPRGAVPRAPRRRARRARLPGQRLRRPGAALGQGDRDVLQGELRRELPDVRQDARRRRGARTRCSARSRRRPARRSGTSTSTSLDRRGAGRRALRRGHRAGRRRSSATRRRLLAATCSELPSDRERMFCVVPERIPPRIQGDCGEFSAIGWFLSRGAKVFLPFEHSPDVDLVADLGDRLLRVQVKTSTVLPQQPLRRSRSPRAAATRAGAASSSKFSPTQCDYLFVHVGDGRRWFIPSEAVEGGSRHRLSADRSTLTTRSSQATPLEAMAAPRIARLADPRRGSRAVKGTRL